MSKSPKGEVVGVLRDRQNWTEIPEKIMIKTLVDENKSLHLHLASRREVELTPHENSTIEAVSRSLVRVCSGIVHFDAVREPDKAQRFRINIRRALEQIYKIDDKTYEPRSVQYEDELISL